MINSNKVKFAGLVFESLSRSAHGLWFPGCRQQQYSKRIVSCVTSPLAKSAILVFVATYFPFSH